MTQPPLIRSERHGDILLMRIDNPPVNALSPPVFTAFGHAIKDFERDATARALVIACAGRTFVAGGDIASFDDPSFTAAPFNRMLARMERLDRPVVAAIHGFALGGGLELALACHWRVATPDAQLGLPEVKLGLLPGSLGTQRLPRLLGIALAYDLIATGRSLDARAALACGLIDAIAEEDIVAAGLAFARRQLDCAVAPRRSSDLTADTTGLPPNFFEQERRRVRLHSAPYPAALAIVDAVEASLQPFAQGEQVEARAFEALRNSPESKAMRYLFFARRRAMREPPLPQAAVDRLREAYLQQIRLLQQQGTSASQIEAALQSFGFAEGPSRPFASLSDAAGTGAAAIPHEEIVNRLLLALTNEGTRLLAEGIVQRSSDIDVAWTSDHGFPDYRGGPMYFADT